MLDRFSKNTQISNLVKIRLVAAQLLHADRQTDMTNFRNFANEPKTVGKSIAYRTPISITVNFEFSGVATIKIMVFWDVISPILVLR